jgi:hypothetical protein
VLMASGYAIFDLSPISALSHSHALSALIP